MRKIALLLALSFLSSSPALAIYQLEPADCKMFTAAAASADQTSAAVNLMGYRTGSVQVVWASLTGSVDGTIKLQVSNDKVNWVDKDGASFTLSGASGTNLISLLNITEKWYREVYAHTSISGGTVTSNCAAKE